MLRLTRQQLALMPAFAMTAHTAQGQSFNNAAIVDLRLGSSSAMAPYVAITRVERREDLLILAPFPRTLFHALAEARPPASHASVARGKHRLD